MGLDDLIDENTEDRYPVGSVSSRMNPQSLSLNRFGWTWVIAHNPDDASLIARNTTAEGAKLVISIIDDLLEDEINGLKIRDVTKEEFKRIRENIIEKKL